MKTPDDPWDATAWCQYLHTLESDWKKPGGLDFETFINQFVFAIVPSGWIKSGYGPQREKNGREQNDIGKGHVALLKVYFHGEAAKDLLYKSVETAIRERDDRFFSDFKQALDDLWNSIDSGSPFLAASKRTIEFMVLTSLLAEPQNSYRPCVLQRLVNRRYQGNLRSVVVHDKNVGKAMDRLGIRKEKRHA